MFITNDDNMKDFNMDMVEVMSQTKNMLILRTSDLLPTLKFMQQCWRSLRELLPDDENGTEYNLLTFYKKKPWKKTDQSS